MNTQRKPRAVASPTRIATDDAIAMLGRLAPRAAELARVATGLAPWVLDSTAGQRVIGRILAQTHKACREAVGDNYYVDHPCLPQALTCLFDAISEPRISGLALAIARANLAYVLATRGIQPTYRPPSGKRIV